MSKNLRYFMTAEKITPKYQPSVNCSWCFIPASFFISE